jgi:hypothetical protein
MAKRKKKGSGCGGCLLVVFIGVTMWYTLTRPIPPENPEQVKADQNRALDNRIKVLTEEEASLRQSAAEYRAKAKAEYNSLTPELRKSYENMVRGDSGHYGYKRLEGNARYADQLADETRREIERLKASRNQ